MLPAPPDTDAINNVASAQAVPHAQGVTTDDAALGTKHVTVQALQASARARALSIRRTADGAITPAAATGTATTYTPAQIRAAYALPALPASSVVPTALQAAQQGAGQTIYIVDAMHDPNVAAELAAFNSTYFPQLTGGNLAQT
ncbi:MAG: hypothetical protein JF606_27715 [Burkholderiales bacterium]|nr:hypothetical protein [Burkholderiales bacterium]